MVDTDPDVTGPFAASGTLGMWSVCIFYKL